MIRGALDWLDSRAGWRTIRGILLDERLPAGTGWFFTLGSVLLGLLGVQLLTGAFLTLYYAPTPDHAYDSVRFISSGAAGRIVRGLHHYGASFIVVVIVLHMLRVVTFGSYKPPRELTWISGIVLLLLVLAFSLTGYLLPWDQRAYWATVVTINIAKLAPFAGDLTAGLMRGGEAIGALTLTRWYAAHVIFLPALLLVLIVAHLALMRRHGISGPVRAKTGGTLTFYPWQAAKDVTIVVLVLAALTAVAWGGAPALDGRADPSDANYIPRPEWYFLGLFQLLKYFPGKWEVVGAMAIPGAAFTILALLPWLDRSRERSPRQRPLVMIGAVAALCTVIVLTALGWRDRPVNAGGEWSLREIGGRGFVAAAACAKCHGETGLADPLDRIALTRGAEWIGAHVADPEVIAPGLREPPVAVNENDAAAIVAYVRQVSHTPYPGFPAHVEAVAAIFARYCVGCHKIDGDGGTDGPDLTRIGAKHDAATLRTWIADPVAVNPDAEMPAFRKRLSPGELDAIASYLSSRR